MSRASIRKRMAFSDEVKRRLLWGTAVVACLLFVAAQFEWKTKKEVLYQWDAMVLNPFSVAEAFIKQQGKQVKTVYGNSFFNQSIEDVDFILLSSKRFPLTEQKLKQLMDWVDAGGHLFASAQYGVSRDESLNRDTLFEFLEVSYVRSSETSCKVTFDDRSDHEVESVIDTNIEAEIETEIEKPDTELNQSDNESTELLETDTEEKPLNRTEQLDQCSDGKFLERHFQCSDWIEQRLVEVSLQQGDETTLAYFGREGYLLDENEVGSEANAIRQGEVVMLSFPFGEGHITLAVDDEPWKNFNIDRFDHAYILARLTEPHDRIWFIRDVGGYPHWMRLFWIYAWPLITSFMIFGILYLWKRGLRFGPVLTKPHDGVRNIMEHIDASSQFHRKHLGVESLFKVVHQDVIELVKWNYFTEKLTDGDCARLAEEISSPQQPVTQEELAKVLLHPPPIKMTDVQFLEAIKLLKKVRERWQA